MKSVCIVFVMITAASFLMAVTSQGTDSIYVSGKVLCQDCTDGWNEWVRGAKPIKGMFWLVPNLILWTKSSRKHVYAVLD